MNKDLENKIEEAFLENVCDVSDNVTYGVFRRIAEYFYNEGREDALREKK